jgi:hypothetical protein
VRSLLVTDKASCRKAEKASIIQSEEEKQRRGQAEPRMARRSRQPAAEEERDIQERRPSNGPKVANSRRG